jgi:hypothetical protein
MVHVYVPWYVHVYVRTYSSESVHVFTHGTYTLYVRTYVRMYHGSVLFCYVRTVPCTRVRGHLRLQTRSNAQQRKQIRCPARYVRSVRTTSVLAST